MALGKDIEEELPLASSLTYINEPRRRSKNCSSISDADFKYPNLDIY